MTEFEIRKEFELRKLPGVKVRLADNGGAYWASIELTCDGRYYSRSIRVSIDPDEKEMQNASVEFQQWIDEVRE